MAYQTGVSSSASELLAALLDFSVANAGYTRGPTWSWNNGISTARSLLRNGVYFVFVTATNDPSRVWINTCTAIDTSKGDNQQVGSSSGGARCDLLAGPFVGHHFFADNYGVNVAVEVVTGVYTHFNFGEIVRNGDWEGGQYATGLHFYSRDANYMRDLGSVFNYLPFDSLNMAQQDSDYTGCPTHIRTPNNGPIARLRRNGTTTTAWNTGWCGNQGRDLIDYSPNKANGRAVLVPMNIVQATNGTASPFLQLGYVSNARLVNIANLNAKEMVNGDWMVFPICQKQGPGTTYLNSGNYGIAYRK